MSIRKFGSGEVLPDEAEKDVEPMSPIEKKALAQENAEDEQPSD